MTLNILPGDSVVLRHVYKGEMLTNNRVGRHIDRLSEVSKITTSSLKVV